MPQTEQGEDVFIPGAQTSTRQTPPPQGQGLLPYLSLLLRAFSSGAARRAGVDSEFVPRTQTSPAMDIGSRLAPLLSGQQVTPASLLPPPILSGLEKGQIRAPIKTSSQKVSLGLTSPAISAGQKASTVKLEEPLETALPKVAERTGQFTTDVAAFNAFRAIPAIKAINPILGDAISASLTEITRPLEPEKRKNIMTAINDIAVRSLTAGAGVGGLSAFIRAITPVLAGNLAKTGQKLTAEQLAQNVQRNIPKAQKLQQAQAQRQTPKQPAISEVEPQPVQITPPQAKPVEISQEAIVISTPPSERGSLFIGNKVDPDKLLKAADASLERAITATQTKEKKNILQQLGQAVKEFHDRWRKAYSFGWVTKEWPEFTNSTRIAMDFPIRAEEKSLDTLAGILNGLDPVIGKSQLQRLIAAKTFETRGIANKNLPSGVTVEKAQKYLEFLAKNQRDDVNNTLSKHVELMKQIKKDLIERGKLDPEDGFDFYYPHQLIKYLDSKFDNLAWIPRELKEAFRGYTKKTVGSELDIETDYIKAMHRHLTRYYLDNMLDDYLLKYANKFDITKRLTAEEYSQMVGTITKQLPDGNIMESPAPVIPGHNYKHPTEDRIYVGWQINPGRLIHKGLTTDERKVSDLLIEALTPEEYAATIKESPILGQYKKTYLIPEEVAYTFNNFREKQPNQPIQEVIRFGTKLWKNVLLPSLGVMFSGTNFLGGMAESYFMKSDILMKYPKALRYMLLNDFPKLREYQVNLLTSITKQLPTISRLMKLDPEKGVQKAIELFNFGKEQAIFKGSSGFGAKFGLASKLAQDPRLAQYEDSFLKRAAGSKFNPLNFWDLWSGYMEDIPRFASVISDVADIQAGKILKTKGIFDIKGLSIPDAVGKLARVRFTDYMATTQQFRKEIRDLYFPFVTFFADKFSVYSKYIQKNPAEFIAKAGIPLGALTLWNNTGERASIETSLPDWIRYTPHLIPGTENENGTIPVITFTDPVTVWARIIGFDKLLDNALKVKRGELTVNEAAAKQVTDTLKAPFQQAAMMFNPYATTLVELIANKNKFGHPIIKDDKLIGTKTGYSLQAQYAVKSLVKPYAQYVYSSNSIKEGNTFQKFLFQGGPLDVQRAIGYREIEPDQLTRGNIYNSISRHESVLAEHKYMLEQSLINSFSSGNIDLFKDDLKQFIREKSAYVAWAAARGSKGSKLSGLEAIQTGVTKQLMSSSRFMIEITRNEISSTSNPERKKKLLEILRTLENRRDFERVSKLPISIRNKVLQDILKARFTKSKNQ